MNSAKQRVFQCKTSTDSLIITFFCRLVLLWEQWCGFLKAYNLLFALQSCSGPYLISREYFFQEFLGEGDAGSGRVLRCAVSWDWWGRCPCFVQHYLLGLKVSPCGGTQNHLSAMSGLRVTGSSWSIHQALQREVAVPALPLEENSLDAKSDAATKKL